MKIFRVVFLVLAFTASAVASASDPIPWTFDMTHAEVTAVTAYAPYGTFKNGDLETYKGMFDGRERNFQFFFKNDKLEQIGIYTYEGQDAAAAGQAWLALYKSMVKQFGVVGTPNNPLPSFEAADADAAFATRAMLIVQERGKTQMAPLKQPPGKTVFASLITRELNGHRFYYVILYMVRPS